MLSLALFDLRSLQTMFRSVIPKMTILLLCKFLIAKSTVFLYSSVCPGETKFRKGSGCQKYSELGLSPLGYKNHKSCKILPKFLSTLHFLQESYKFVQESQTLKFVTMSIISYKILITFLQKMHFFSRSFYKKCDVSFRPKFQKSSNYQQQQHSCRLQCTNCLRIPAKGPKLLILSKKNYFNVVIASGVDKIT